MFYGVFVWWKALEKATFTLRNCWAFNSRELSINTNFRLPDYCRVFLAKVAAVKIAIEILLRNAASGSGYPLRLYSGNTSLELNAHALKAGYGMPNFTINGIRLFLDKTILGTRAYRIPRQVQSWWINKKVRLSSSRLYYFIFIF